MGAEPLCSGHHFQSGGWQDRAKFITYEHFYSIPRNEFKTQWNTVGVADITGLFSHRKTPEGRSGTVCMTSLQRHDSCPMCLLQESNCRLSLDGMCLWISSVDQHFCFIWKVFCLFTDMFLVNKMTRGHYWICCFAVFIERMIQIKNQYSSLANMSLVHMCFYSKIYY